MSRVCEEFGCLPAAAQEALEEDEGGLIFKIIDLRSYAAAKHHWDNDPKHAKGKAVERVKAIELELAGIDITSSKE